MLYEPLDPFITDSSFTLQDIYFGLYKKYSIEDLRRWCRNGDILAKKEGNGPIKHWTISAESFILWTRYNPSSLIIEHDDINHITTKGTTFRGAIRYMNSKIPYAFETSYSFKQICTLLDKSARDVRKLIRNGEFPSVSKFGKITGRANEITLIDLLHYFDRNEDELPMLQDRYILMLSSGSENIDLARHILMVYTYYKKNGYAL